MPFPPYPHVKQEVCEVPAIPKLPEFTNFFYYMPMKSNDKLVFSGIFYHGNNFITLCRCRQEVRVRNKGTICN